MVIYIPTLLLVYSHAKYILTAVLSKQRVAHYYQNREKILIVLSKQHVPYYQNKVKIFKLVSKQHVAHYYQNRLKWLKYLRTLSYLHGMASCKHDHKTSSPGISYYIFLHVSHQHTIHTYLYMDDHISANVYLK